MITEAMKTAMQGLFPSLIATCALDGTPNATIISQVYFVDQTHVALSHQFFNKTYKNVRANPYVEVIISSPELRGLGRCGSATTIPRPTVRCSTRWTCSSRRSPR